MCLPNMKYVESWWLRNKKARCFLSELKAFLLAVGKNVLPNMKYVKNLVLAKQESNHTLLKLPMVRKQCWSVSPGFSTPLE